MGFGAREIAKRHYAEYLPQPSREDIEDLDWARTLWAKGMSIAAISAETGLPVRQLDAEFLNTSRLRKAENHGSFGTRVV